MSAESQKVKEPKLATKNRVLNTVVGLAIMTGLFWGSNAITSAAPSGSETMSIWVGQDNGDRIIGEGDKGIPGVEVCFFPKYQPAICGLTKENGALTEQINDGPVRLVVTPPSGYQCIPENEEDFTPCEKSLVADSNYVYRLIMLLVEKKLPFNFFLPLIKR